MKKISKWIQNRLPSKRRLIQVYAALLYNAHLKGFTDGEIFKGISKSVCVPGLNCYSCPAAVGACPLGALQNALASVNARAPYYIVGILLLFGLTLGRTICGFLCPFGLLQELLHRIPTPKVRKSRVTRVLSLLKYLILVSLVLLIPLSSSFSGTALPAFCKYICPAGTLEGAVALISTDKNEGLFSMLGALFAHKFIILVVILAACVFVYRAFCRFLCPLGAIYSLFSRLSIAGVEVREDRCTHCGKCVQACKMDVARVGDRECIHCGECMRVCPENAICRRPNRKIPGKAVAIFACVLLVFVFVFANAPSAQDAIPVADDSGARLPSFSVPLLNGDTFSTDDLQGKITVINLWATWCGPCCEELSNFERLLKTYPDDVRVIAIHTSLVTEDVSAYVRRLNIDLPFALDEDGSVASKFGGATILPVTVIADRNGHVVYSQPGSLSYEALESYVVPLIR